MKRKLSRSLSGWICSHLVYGVYLSRMNIGTVFSLQVKKNYSLDNTPVSLELMELVAQSQDIETDDGILVVSCPPEGQTGKCHLLLWDVDVFCCIYIGFQEFYCWGSKCDVEW